MHYAYQIFKYEWKISHYILFQFYNWMSLNCINKIHQFLSQKRKKKKKKGSFYSANFVLVSIKIKKIKWHELLKSSLLTTLSIWLAEFSYIKITILMIQLVQCWHGIIWTFTIIRKFEDFKKLYVIDFIGKSRGSQSEVFWKVKERAPHVANNQIIFETRYIYIYIYIYIYTHIPSKDTHSKLISHVILFIFH